MKASELLELHARWLDGAFGEFDPPPGVEVRVEAHTASRNIVGWSLLLDASVPGQPPVRAKVTWSQFGGNLIVSPQGFPLVPGVVSSVQDVCDAMAAVLER